MGNLRLFLIGIVLCATFEDVLCQNRGSSRYIPTDDEYDGESTRAQRPAPTRRTSVRRQRPAPTPEPPASEEEPKEYPVRNQGGTTGRRVPSRVSPQQYVPPAPPAPLPADDPPVPEDLPVAPPVAPEGKPRRRRPKKRRRPQGAAAPEVVPGKDGSDIGNPEGRTVPRVELLDTDQKRPQSYQSNPDQRNNPNAYDSSIGLVDKPSWLSEKEDTSDESGRGNSAGTQYYPPQTGTNRLPIENSEGNPPTYSEHSPHAPSQDHPKSRYAAEPEAESPNKESYVPVISPIRKSEGTSRLPHEEYVDDRSADSSRYYEPSERRIPQRTTGHRSPPHVNSRPEDAVRNSGAKPPHSAIPHSSQPQRGSSEVRLPPTEQPYIDHGYDNSYNSQSGYGPENPTGNNQEETNLANRYPSEDSYESNYPTFMKAEISLEEQSHGPTPPRNQDTPGHNTRNAASSYRNAQPQETAKSAENKNRVDTDRRQVSRYEPPLQRTGSRYNPDESIPPSRSRSPAPVQPTEQPTRSRTSSRYQPDGPAETYTRTRTSSRFQVEVPTDEPTRTRKPKPEAPSQRATGSRNTQRYQPDSEDGSRTSTRRQPPSESHSGGSSQVVDRSYRQRVPVPQAEVPTGPQHYNRSPYSDSEEETRDGGDPVRNTLRSRPQFDAGDNTEPYEGSYEGSSEEHHEANPYVPEYQAPRQEERPERYNQRPSPNREQAERSPTRHSGRRENTDNRNVQRQPQPEYEAPPPQYNTRQQPQYRAPPREEPKQTTRQQPRSRHQESAPAPSHGRHTSASKFSCPEAYGFFADHVQCDKYYECRNGTAIDSLCEDGLVFNEISAPKYLRCDSLRDVDCSSRPELQKASPTKNCPRRYGLFPHETDCTKFWNCVDGSATEVQCPPGLTYNDDRATCDWADLVKTSCKTEDLLGFTCPEPNAYDLQDGVYTSYPHPDNCQLHFVCIKGEDGERRPRMLSCNEGLVYNPESKSCTRPDDVAGCEDFYGSRSPAPKRKPAREPVPEPEEIEEPAPRRRVVQHRRPRN